MDKELFDEFDEMEFEDIPKASEDEENVLMNLARTLTDNQIAYIVNEWMKYNNKSEFTSRAYDESTGSKLLHFRMQVESGYYLDDIEEDSENE